MIVDQVHMKQLVEIKKTCIRETRNLSTNADSGTDTFFRCFSSGDCRLWTSSHQGDRVLMAVRNTFFIAGYGPLQRSHQGDHHEIAGYGPLQSSHQGYRVLIDQ